MVGLLRQCPWIVPGLVVAYAVPRLLVTWTRWLRIRTAAPSYALWIAYLLLGVGGAAFLYAPVGLAIVAVEKYDLVGLEFRFIPPALWTERAIVRAVHAMPAMWAATVLVTSLWLLFVTWRWRSRSAIAKDNPP